MKSAGVRSVKKILILLMMFLLPVMATASQELRERRATLAQNMSDYSVLVMFPETQKTRNDDVEWPYRQSSNFYYLTNDPNMHSHFVLLRNGGAIEERIFTQLADPQFELWEGKLPTVESLRDRTGVEHILELDKFEDFLHSILLGTVAETDREFRYNQPEHRAFYHQLEQGNVEFWLDLGRSRRLDDNSPPTAAQEFADQLVSKFPEIKIRNISSALRLMRQVKSEYLAAMKEVQTARWEYEVQAKVDQTFRKEGGCCWSYPSIVGNGENATILHYTANNEAVRKGDLFLLDAGAEYAHYATDITRTFPVSGTFSDDQKTVYEIVLKAQREAIAGSISGSNMKTINQTASDVIAEGLIELGLMTENNFAQVGSYFVHGLGHSVGLDVHDAFEYHQDFEAGNVITVEPGIYIRKKDVLAKDWYKALDEDDRDRIAANLDRYGGIGVRIEDQIIITDGEPTIMSLSIPYTVADIEATMAAMAQTTEKDK
jgi:Xaa-Pro aminopeptidase